VVVDWVMRRLHGLGLGMSLLKRRVFREHGADEGGEVMMRRPGGWRGIRWVLGASGLRCKGRVGNGIHLGLVVGLGLVGFFTNSIALLVAAVFAAFLVRASLDSLFALLALRVDALLGDAVLEAAHAGSAGVTPFAGLLAVDAGVLDLPALWADCVGGRVVLGRVGVHVEGWMVVVAWVVVLGGGRHDAGRSLKNTRRIGFRVFGESEGR